MTTPLMTQDTLLLLVDNNGMESHLIRWLAAEKAVPYRNLTIKNGEKNVLLDATPYGDVPVLVHRRISLYSPEVIAEYLQELTPFPSFMPADIAERARQRQLLYKLLSELFPLIESCVAAKGTDTKANKEARKQVRKQLSVWLDRGRLSSTEPELTIVDLAFGVILARKDVFGLIPSHCHAKAKAYWADLQKRVAFREGLSEIEEEWVKS